MSNPGNVAGGLKATINNPKVSDEAKQHAQSRLENEEFSSANDRGGETKNPGNVLGGIKAAINNPNVSDSKKDELRHKLNEEDY
ncbi:Conidiation protein 6-domain-containing protein [Phakopsora pachyrhizi]|uniref:Conidiation protein 6-domain-containing protein n=1 Tax=Phakopsora pachyrhizi TaxID=170000 RepID=A0AAV0AZY0_PHAPC|nr:Conidiation protein 6-domain-containing protein [Phakopsora pachyrhizi]CAH7675253.1 Conidiation protein 6-domain-containing protein [Phakopsora pachyrhizi]